MKKTAVILITILFTASCASEEVSNQDQFFDLLSSRCGDQYTGESVYPEGHELWGASLLMTIESCTEDEIRIPFQVDDDRSRTWIITKTEEGLLLKHDHRDPETGEEHDLTNYGGYATEDGTPTTQYFAADDETAEMLPEAATNVWKMELNEEEGKFIYYLERHEAPRYRAEFTL